MKENLLPSLLNGRRRKERESHLMQEDLLKPTKTPRTQKDEIDMSNPIIVFEKVTMLEIAPRREMLQEETLQDPTTITVATTTTAHMIKEMEEGMIEEEETLPMIVKKVIVHKRDQEIPGLSRLKNNSFLQLPVARMGLINMMFTPLNRDNKS